MNGIELIAEERQRQMLVENFKPAHDANLTAEQLAEAAMCYLMGDEEDDFVEEHWPFGPEWWKPSTRLRDLIKAGALVAAEIDRLLAMGVER